MYIRVYLNNGPYSSQQGITRIWCDGPRLVIKHSIYIYIYMHINITYILYLHKNPHEYTQICILLNCATCTDVGRLVLVFLSNVRLLIFQLRHCFGIFLLFFSNPFFHFSTTISYVHWMLCNDPSALSFPDTVTAFPVLRRHAYILIFIIYLCIIHIYMYTSLLYPHNYVTRAGISTYVIF